MINKFGNRYGKFRLKLVSARYFTLEKCHLFGLHIGYNRLILPERKSSLLYVCINSPYESRVTLLRYWYSTTQASRPCCITNSVGFWKNISLASEMAPNLTFAPGCLRSWTRAWACTAARTAGPAACSTARRTARTTRTTSQRIRMMTRSQVRHFKTFQADPDPRIRSQQYPLPGT